MQIIGNEFLVEFGMAKARLRIDSETSLTFTILEKDGSKVEISETVETKMTEIRPQLFLVTWQEESGTTVTQIQDYENGEVYSNWTSPSGEFKNVKGTLKPLAHIQTG
ncbi:hypothetical protein GS399_19355 [Pedobacter sp. HMF7647]|uniref:MoaF-like domain-containing protein n=1 Tax=Hufsiella arboris TaxID=2695275 RepID=A0A7K1YGH2_9SPHI|nr:hypothetical protein [Hufsiella arboris]MXV53129.1 hypothetical protein [Hufsiella arboris]